MTWSRQKVFFICFKKVFMSQKHVNFDIYLENIDKRRRRVNIGLKTTILEVFRCTNSNHLILARRHCAVSAIYQSGDVTHGVLSPPKKLPLACEISNESYHSLRCRRN